MWTGLRPTAMHPSVLAFLARRNLTIAAWERQAGLSRCALWRLLAGRRRLPRLDTVERLARVAGVSVSSVARLFAKARHESDERTRGWRNAALRRGSFKASSRTPSIDQLFPPRIRTSQVCSCPPFILAPKTKPMPRA